MKQRTILAALAAVVIATAHAGGGWTKYEKNPVLGIPELGTCFDVNVIA